MENKKDIKLQVVDISIDKETSIKKRVEALSKGRWLLTQELLQEIQAFDIILNSGNPKSVPALADQVSRLPQAIDDSYADNLEIASLLKESLPTSNQTFWRWTKEKGWDEAVMDKIKASEVFSPSKKIAMLNTLYEKGKDKGDTRAMELYFKLAGDLVVEKVKKDSKEFEDYKDFNKILHSKK